MTRRTALPIHPDPCPDLLVERGPDAKGVGDWVPRVKHLLLADYIGAASGAMKAWPERVFIDPFCGPGRIQVAGETLTRDGGSVVAWRQSQDRRVGYTHLLIGDIDTERADACRQRLATLGASPQAFPGPADETVHSMVKAVPRNALCLAYLDPYNLALLSFEMIKTLAELPKVDFAVHFSTMDLLRNVDAELGDRARFDQVAPGWREALKGTSKSALPVAFLNYWIDLVKSLGFKFSREITLVKNDSSREIYRLVFFARHDLPVKLWSDVARSDNLGLFDS